MKLAFYLEAGKSRRKTWSPLTDSQLRELERRWKESGSVDDESAYLVERIRVGELEENMVELAVMLDHPAAIQAVSRAYSSQLELPEWARRAAILFQEVAARIAIAAAQEVLHISEDRSPGNTQPRRSIEAAIAWVRDPSPKRKTTSTFFAAQSAYWAAYYAAYAIHGSDYASTADAANSAAFAATDATHAPSEAIEMVTAYVNQSYPTASVIGEQQIREAIMNALVPWALGYCDPLLDSNEEETPPSD